MVFSLRLLSQMKCTLTVGPATQVEFALFERLRLTKKIQFNFQAKALHSQAQKP